MIALGLMIEISVKLVLVLKSAVCKGPYKPGRSDDLTPDDVSKLEQKSKNSVSDFYKLQSRKTMPLPLPLPFHQALIPAIATGTYAVLLVFDWGTPLKVVVDLVPGPAQNLPEWSKKQPKYDNGQLWYAHQNAVGFDPDQSVTWQLTLNGPKGSTFSFYAVPAS
jgi:hypothetical protein